MLHRSRYLTVGRNPSVHQSGDGQRRQLRLKYPVYAHAPLLFRKYPPKNYITFPYGIAFTMVSKTTVFEIHR